MVFPWQTTQWQQIQRAKQENRMPHALLLLGIHGTGKTQFANDVIRAQLCQRTDAASSDHLCDCHSCRLVLGRAHPNVLWIEPEKAGGVIKIDQIREVNEFINQTSLQGEYRFVLINPASNMNANAANALLKTLEEPSSGAILLLISDQASHLPATILSRCQHIQFPRPQTELALTWLTKQLPANSSSDPELLLRLANGAPVTALELAKTDMLAERVKLFQILISLSLKQIDPLKSAADLQDWDAIQFLDLVLYWSMDLLRLQSGCGQNDIMNKDFINELRKLHTKISSDTLSQYMSYVQQLHGQIRLGINLNKQLMLENVLIRWMEIVYVSG